MPAAFSHQSDSQKQIVDQPREREEDICQSLLSLEASRSLVSLSSIIWISVTMTTVVDVADSSSLKLPVLSTLDDPIDDYSSCGQSEEGGQISSDSELKDSGIDCNPDLPDEETSAEILKMVEFYLSDENILKDPFLLKHVRRNKEGFVSVKLLASFRKVRSLSHNWQAVSGSVQKSKVLELNPDGTKVRRLLPLPDHDETTQSRMVIAHGFGSTEKPSVESISEIFSKCGDIALVRILRPGGSTPTDVKRFLAKNPEIQSQICALVEFEDHASAKRASALEHEGFKVLSLLTKDAPSSETPGDAAKESPKKKKKRNKRKAFDSNLLSDGYQNRRGSSGSLSSQSSGYLSSSPIGGFFENRFPRRHSLNPALSYNDPNSSFASLGNRHYNSRDRLNKDKKPDQDTVSDSLSPWRRRREQQQLMMMSDSNLPLSTRAPMSSSTLSLPVKTLRMPKGPDGTKGFGPRPRARLPSTAE